MSCNNIYAVFNLKKTYIFKDTHRGDPIAAQVELLQAGRAGEGERGDLGDAVVGQVELGQGRAVGQRGHRVQVVVGQVQDLQGRQAAEETCGAKSLY